MKKILIIGYYHLKKDKRVFRTVKALSKKCQVSYQYLSNEDNKISFENNTKYIPIFLNINPSENIFKKAIKRIKFDKKILKIIKNEDFDILYMHHFLPTFPLKPFKFVKKKQKIIIYDLHELHPENFLESLPKLLRIIKEKIMWNIFKKQLQLSDKLIFVSKEIQEYVFNHLKFKKKYLIFPNFSNISISSKEKNKEICLVGKISRDVQKEERILKKLIENGFIFKIIGMDSEKFKDLEHISTKFLPYNKMMEELSKASFSLISYGSKDTDYNKNYTFALPNKFFDSIAAETPVIVKDTFVSMKKIVEKYGIGVVINPNNIEESVEKILKAYENYDQLIENIKKHKNKFVWDEEKEKEFVDFVLK